MVPFAEIEKFLGSKPDAARKAVKRAAEEEGIIEGQREFKNSYCLFVPGVDDEM